ncbi:MAG: TldD/PmbA family protein [Actinobacteria bacterium]|nr:TldD/PmbA family protein [Actinomycetota bacterium]
MIDEKQALELVEMALSASTADQSEVVVYSSDSALTRFSNNYIHQNVFESNVHISVRSIVDKRIGYSSTNRIDERAVREMMARSVEIAKRRPPNPEFASLPGQSDYPQAQPFSEETAHLPPEVRARSVATLIERVREFDLSAAGSYATSGSLVAVGNTLGVRAAARLSEASLKTVVMGEDSSGYASAISNDARAIDAVKVAEMAVDKTLKSATPVDLEPGRYKVILAPEAVADMIAFLAYAGLSALSVQEGRSFMAGKFGQRIVDERISIWDDALDARTVGLPFDFEGVPKRRVELIADGVAANVVYDTFTANREGKSSTGHALPAPNPYGPLPTNLFVGEGRSSASSMIASLDRGVFVTRFHYTNLEDPLKTILTGMTRDGTFLIENGELTAGVKNFRFTQSILEALSKVSLVSAERELVESMLGLAFVPYLRIDGFNFTGATRF